MTVKIDYKNAVSKKNSDNLVLFVGKNFDIGALKKHIPNSEYSFVYDLLKIKDKKKKNNHL